MDPYSFSVCLPDRSGLTVSNWAEAQSSAPSVQNTIGYSGFNSRP